MSDQYKDRYLGACSVAVVACRVYMAVCVIYFFAVYQADWSHVGSPRAVIGDVMLDDVVNFALGLVVASLIALFASMHVIVQANRAHRVSFRSARNSDIFVLVLHGMRFSFLLLGSLSFFCIPVSAVFLRQLVMEDTIIEVDFFDCVYIPICSVVFGWLMYARYVTFVRTFKREQILVRSQ